MSSDSINDQIREVRRDLAAPFENDLDLILADLRRREASDGRRYVALPPRVVSRKTSDRSETQDSSSTPFPSRE